MKNGARLRPRHETLLHSCRRLDIATRTHWHSCCSAAAADTPPCRHRWTHRHWQQAASSTSTEPPSNPIPSYLPWSLMRLRIITKWLCRRKITRIYACRSACTSSALSSLAEKALLEGIMAAFESLDMPGAHRGARRVCQMQPGPPWHSRLRIMVVLASYMLFVADFYRSAWPLTLCTVHLTGSLTIYRCALFTQQHQAAVAVLFMLCMLGMLCNRRVCLAIVPAAESLCQTSIWNYARYFLVLRHRQVLYRRQATSKFAHGGYQCSQSREQLRRISSRCQHFQPCVRRSHTCECTYCLKPDCSTEQLRELLHWIAGGFGGRLVLGQVDDGCGGFAQSPCGVPIRSPCAPSAARCWRACHMPHASMRVKESKPVFPIHVCVAFQEQHLRVQHWYPRTYWVLVTLLLWSIAPDRGTVTWLFDGMQIPHSVTTAWMCPLHHTYVRSFIVAMKGKTAACSLTLSVRGS